MKPAFATMYAAGGNARLLRAAAVRWDVDAVALLLAFEAAVSAATGIDAENILCLPSEEESMHRKAGFGITGFGIIGAALAAAALVTVPALAADDDGGGVTDRAMLAHCARQFDEAQRTDMESFRDFDRDTWVAGHDDDAITIFTTGRMEQGRDRIAEVMKNHFINRNAVWTWTELTRAVDGCKTGTIVYDATYAIPSQDLTLREIVSVTYTYKHGKWLSVLDQGTEIPAAAPAAGAQRTLAER